MFEGVKLVELIQQIGVALAWVVVGTVSVLISLGTGWFLYIWLFE